MYNFDEVVNRYGTDCIKYDFREEHKVPQDAIPLWVADMDFKTAPEIVEAVKKRAAHEIYGYTGTKDDLHDAICNWFGDNFGYRYQKEWLVKTPGVVFALSLAVRAFTEPGDAVIIQRPVYHPFSRSIKNNGRRLIDSPLVYDKEEAAYSIDFEDFEDKIVKNDVKMFILCSPHNPVGRVWTREELVQIDEICRRHQVFVVSDEIHCDFTYGDHKHTIFASVSKEAEQNCMVCTAPSKTFNLAGLQFSSIFIPNKEKRRKFIHEIEMTGYNETNLFGATAAYAAYTQGKPWLLELRKYLAENIRFMNEFLADQMPMLKMTETQGTYLTWVDCSGLGYTEEELNHRILYDAGLWLDEGSMFGPSGKQFERINIACPKSVLEQALAQLKKIVP